MMDLGANISEAQREPGVNVNATKMRNNFGSTNAPDGLSSDLRAIKLTLYVVIFLVSVLGNSLVCTVILRRKKMKTVTNYFILNLSIADLTFTCICIPFDIPVQEMGGLWPYGALLCKVVYPLQTLLLFASIYTLTAVSLSRYWAINHPLRKQITTKWAKWIILGIWISSIIPVIPYIQVSKKNSLSGKCEEEWSSKNSRKTYTACLFVFEYLFPLTVISVAYASIGWELRRRAQNGNPCLQDRKAKEAKKIVRMLKIVTLLFAVCLLPNNILWIWLDFGNAEEKYEGFWDLVAFGNIITFANSAANPICYTILNETYRDAFKDQLSKAFYRIAGKLLLRRNRFTISETRIQRTGTMDSVL